MVGGRGRGARWSGDRQTPRPLQRDVIGLPGGMEAPGVVIFGDPNSPAVALGTHSEVHGKSSDPARHIVGFDTDDIKADCARLKSAGVEFVEEPNKQGDLWIATFKDPEGNLLQLFQSDGQM